MTSNHRLRCDDHGVLYQYDLNTTTGETVVGTLTVPHLAEELCTAVNALREAAAVIHGPNSASGDGGSTETTDQRTQDHELIRKLAEATGIAESDIIELRKRFAKYKNTRKGTPDRNAALKSLCKYALQLKENGSQNIDIAYAVGLTSGQTINYWMQEVDIR